MSGPAARPRATPSGLCARPWAGRRGTGWCPLGAQGTRNSHRVWRKAGLPSRSRGRQRSRRRGRGRGRPQAAACFTFFVHSWAKYLCGREPFWEFENSTYRFLNTKSRASIMSKSGNTEMHPKQCDRKRYSSSQNISRRSCILSQKGVFVC